MPWRIEASGSRPTMLWMSLGTISRSWSTHGRPVRSRSGLHHAWPPPPATKALWLWVRPVRARGNAVHLRHSRESVECRLHVVVVVDGVGDGDGFSAYR